MSHLKPKTRLDYGVTLRRHVLPALGTAPVAMIDRAAMKRFTNDLASAGARPDVVRIAVQVARHVLAVAVEGGALKANPATALRLARPRKPEMLYLNPEQVQALAETIVKPYGTLIRFAAYTGIRAGEIGALRVKSIDFVRGSVEVAESVSDVAGKLIVGPTKTYANRHVPVPRSLLDELQLHLGDRIQDRDALVFTAREGGPLRHGNFYRSYFKTAVRAAGLPERLRFHDLRHTYATFCIASTADPYAVMKRMGHSSITVTYDTYGHMFPERDAEITDRLESLLRRGVDFSWTPTGPVAAEGRAK